MNQSKFSSVVRRIKDDSFSRVNEGNRFERLMKAYFKTDPKYKNLFKEVWLWEEFPFRNSLGGRDTGIDIVCMNNDLEYYAVQCKLYAEGTIVSKADIDSFISTSGRSFNDQD